MKKLIYGSLFLAIVGITSVGCEKELLTSSDETGNSKSKTIKSIDQKSGSLSPGEQHNAYLELYFNSLESDMLDLNTSDVNEQTFKAPFYIDVLNSMTGNVDAKSYSESVFNQILDHDLGQDSYPNFFSDLEDTDLFSSQFKLFIIDFSEQTAFPTNISEKNILCQSYINDVSVEISNIDEQDCALALIDIYDKSFDYWTANTTSWQSLIDPNGTGPIPAASSIAGADFGGAVAGAVVGGTATGGPGAVPGAVIGAVGGSVGAAAAEFWDWCWS